MDILGTISALKTATDIAKAIKNSVDALDQAETKYKMAEIIEALADAKTNLADIKIELLDKDEIIKKLQNEANKKRDLTHDGSKYWLKGDDTPFCPVCYEKEEKMIHLSLSKSNNHTDPSFRTNSYYHCKAGCKYVTHETSNRSN